MKVDNLKRLESKERYLEDILLRSKDAHEINYLKQELYKVRMMISKERISASRIQFL